MLAAMQVGIVSDSSEQPTPKRNRTDGLARAPDPELGEARADSATQPVAHVVETNVLGDAGLHQLRDMTCAFCQSDSDGPDPVNPSNQLRWRYYMCNSHVEPSAEHMTPVGNCCFY